MDDASDALRAARQAPAFLNAIDLHLVETSNALRAVQTRTVENAQPHWHDSVDTVPDGPAIVIANEFFDAPPEDVDAGLFPGDQVSR